MCSFPVRQQHQLHRPATTEPVLAPIAGPSTVFHAESQQNRGSHFTPPQRPNALAVNPTPHCPDPGGQTRLSTVPSLSGPNRLPTVETPPWPTHLPTVAVLQWPNLPPNRPPLPSGPICLPTVLLPPSPAAQMAQHCPHAPAAQPTLPLAPCLTHILPSLVAQPASPLSLYLGSLTCLATVTMAWQPNMAPQCP
ncbi:uncharacterized protein LOC135212233 [Macrobrachium nipponense]|uniref:uncharacterized protein LOC135212233 n=1 Tax=Macrobrachium nipponense TaxID=159736 RepID=UPI0030C7FC1D